MGRKRRKFAGTCQHTHLHGVRMTHIVITLMARFRGCARSEVLQSRLRWQRHTIASHLTRLRAALDRQAAATAHAAVQAIRHLLWHCSGWKCESSLGMGHGGSGLATGSIPMREHSSLVVSATSWLPCCRCTTFSALVYTRAHNNNGPCETADEFFSRGFRMWERMTSVGEDVRVSHVCRNADGVGGDVPPDVGGGNLRRI